MSTACWSEVTGTSFNLCIVAIPRTKVPVYCCGSRLGVDPIESSLDGYLMSVSRLTSAYVFGLFAVDVINVFGGFFLTLSLLLLRPDVV